MTLDEYQKVALRTASRKGEEVELVHRVLGLVGEAGEVAEKVKKAYRDENGVISKKLINELKKEMGDVLWYVATLADFFDVSLEDVGQLNISKLESREKRGKLKGSGDNR